MSTDTYGELDRHFHGYARVKLENVDFDSGRELDDRKVKRLLGIFKKQGCERKKTTNAISVLVAKGALGNVLTQQNSSGSGVHFIVPALLPHLNVKVLCLQGKHRICAARKFLKNADRWWTAKVFDAGKAFQSRPGVQTNATVQIFHSPLKSISGMKIPTHSSIRMEKYFGTILMLKDEVIKSQRVSG